MGIRRWADFLEHGGQTMTKGLCGTRQPLPPLLRDRKGHSRNGYRGGDLTMVMYQRASKW